MESQPCRIEYEKNNEDDGYQNFASESITPILDSEMKVMKSKEHSTESITFMFNDDWMEESIDQFLRCIGDPKDVADYMLSPQSVEEK